MPLVYDVCQMVLGSCTCIRLFSCFRHSFWVLMRDCIMTNSSVHLSRQSPNIAQFDHFRSRKFGRRRIVGTPVPAKRRRRSKSRLEASASRRFRRRRTCRSKRQNRRLTWCRRQRKRRVLALVNRLRNALATTRTRRKRAMTTACRRRNKAERTRLRQHLAASRHVGSSPQVPTASNQRHVRTLTTR